MSSTEFFEALAQSLVLGSLWGLLGIGFGLILGVAGRFHFAYATTFVVTVYLALELIDRGLPLYLGIVGGILAATLLGVLIERFVYRPLASAGSGALLGVFVTSLGIVIVGENLIRLIWGSASKSLDTGYTLTRIAVGEVGITNLDAVTFGLCIVLILVVWWMMRFTALGRAMRAVQENPDMAQAVGINPGRIYLVVFAVGSALAGICAVLYAQRTAVTPELGIQPTFIALVVAFLGGVRSSPLRIAVAGFAIATIEQFSLTQISAAWTPVVTFGALFIYVAVSPLADSRWFSTRRIRRIQREA
jgi:branched-chain amino acid transport system permease protein